MISVGLSPSLREKRKTSFEKYYALSLKISSAKLHFYLLLITGSRQFSAVKRKPSCAKIQRDCDRDDEDLTFLVSILEYPPRVAICECHPLEAHE